MKKHHFIKMSSIALSLCVALGTFPATAFADDANATTITKAYVDTMCKQMMSASMSKFRFRLLNIGI